MMHEAALQTTHGIERALHTSLIDAFKGPGRNVVYFGKIRDLDDDTMLIKVGSSESIKERGISLEREFGSICFFKVIDSEIIRDFERYLQKRPKILPLAYNDVIFESRCSNGEVFRMTPDQVRLLLLVAARSAWKFTSHDKADRVIEMARLSNERAVARKEMVKAQLDLADLRMSASGIGLDAERDLDCAEETDESEESDSDDDYDLHIIADEHGYTQSRGTKIQRYTSDGSTLLHTYKGLAVAMRDPHIPDISRPQLKICISNHHVYRGFRWAMLSRNQPDDTVQDIGPTEASTKLLQTETWSQCLTWTGPRLLRFSAMESLPARIGNSRLVLPSAGHSGLELNPVDTTS